MDKLKVVEQLDQLDELGAPAVVELLDSISANDDAYNKLQHEITRTESIAPHVDKKKSDLAAVNGRIQEVDQELGALKREVSVYEADIVKKNIELSKLSGAWDQAKPSLRRASRALKVATMVDSIVNQAVPSQISAVAKAMTQAHHSMAHKKDMVDRIDIDDDCQVRLLNKEGVDLRNYDLSAGEKQIFTQALISAVASVSQRAFPMVIDTPLGRLDVAHRKGVLRHLVQRGHQVILLSTNTEVVGEYLEEIEQNVQKKFLISFERVGDTGESSVREGYFAGQESRK
jgi:DNA sulfur modification protein DndD